MIPAGRAEDDAPGPADDAAAEADALAFGRWLFTQECRFLIGAAEAGQLPPPGLPEVAFAGRSNVGKSSLLNALTGRRALARTSNTPGRTREVNLFDLGGRLLLADLPGYGYARAGKGEIARWNRLIEDYLKGRAPLRRVFLLIDARHGPKAADAPAMALMDEAAVNYQIVLTKIDKTKAEALEKVRRETEAALLKRPAAHPEILLTSSANGTGIVELRAAIAALAETG